MDIHRVFNIDKGKDETYRQNYYKRLERAKAEIEKSFGDIFDIRQASAKLNQYATEFDMNNFKSMDKELNKVVKALSSNTDIKPSELVEVYPSEEIIKLSSDIKEK